jgi:Fic family protein
MRGGDYPQYIWQLPEWPGLTWDHERLATPLAAARHTQGRLIGRMEALGFHLRQEATLQTLTQDVLTSSEIEGERLPRAQVRSSIARRLGMDRGGLATVDRNVEGVVEMMLDATQRHDEALTADRLFAWHAALFPTGRSGMTKIRVGAWRDDRGGPMRVISGPIGRERVHFQAPPAERLPDEMARFLEWFNRDAALDGVVRAAVAHLWLVTIHPFADGNGRIARAVADMALARSEHSGQRFYSMSAQIQQERRAYYRVLERAQRGSLDITAWMEWFVGCLARAVDQAGATLALIMQKASFWARHAGEVFNARQTKVLNRLLDGFHGKLTSSKWARLARCSQDTAYRDIMDLVGREVLAKDPAGGRSTSYSLAPPERPGQDARIE